MNEIPLGMLFGILAALLVLSAFFSGSETALMKLNRYRLQHLAKRKHSGAIKAQKLLQRPDRLLGLILLGNNFVNILASSLATIIAIRLLGQDESGIAIAAGLLTLVVLIFSEVAPKTLAAVKPELIAFPAAWIYTPLLKIFYPIVWIVNLFANLLLRLFGIQVHKKNTEALNIEELKSLVTESDSVIPERYQNMLLSILDMETATVEDIMTPRNEIVGIDMEAPVEEIVTVLENSPHTRLLVYRQTINKVVGILHLRNTLALLRNNNFDKNSLLKNLSKPYFVPESTPLQKQIHTFRDKKMHLALVVDEYGDIQGLVSLDDLLQEIVGGIIFEPSDVVAQQDGSYLVDGSVTIRELNRINHWNLPTEGPKTLNGLIIEFMETIPEPGTSIKLHGYPLEIVKTDKNAIKLVRFYPPKK